VGCGAASYASPADGSLRRRRDRPSARGQGSVPRRQGRASSAGNLADSHRASWGRRDAAMGGNGDGRAGGQSTLRLARRPAARGGVARRVLGGAADMLLLSRGQWGGDVTSEAAPAGIPVLATRIEGSVGLLGRDYPGYLPVGDTEALAQLLNRIETDSAFLER